MSIWYYVSYALTEKYLENKKYLLGANTNNMFT